MATTQAPEEHLRPYKEGLKDWQDHTLYSTKGPEAFLDEHLKKDLMLYGEAAQATYDTVDLQQWSRFRDKSRFAPSHLLDEEHLRNQSHFAELPDMDYTAAVDLKGKTDRAEDENITYMYASEKSDVIRSVVRKIPGQKVTDARVWIGYVAYSPKRQDILVAWRGTQQPHEWLADGKLTQVRYNKYNSEGQAQQAAPKGRWWNPLPLLKKGWFGCFAGAFSLVATAATPLLGILIVLTSPPARPQNRNAPATVWKRIKASPAFHVLVRVPGTILTRLGAATVAFTVLVGVQKAFPSTLNLAAFVLTLPFAFIGAIPFVHVVLPDILAQPAAAVVAALAGKTPSEDANLPYKAYVAAVALADVALRLRPPRFLHGFWATPLGISSIVVAASGLFPLTCAAIIRTWAQAGEKDEAGNVQIWVHEGFHELYTNHQGGHNDDKTQKAAAKSRRSQGPREIEQGLPLLHDKHADVDADVPADKASPQTTLHRRIKALMAAHDVSTISVTGHSLGGALAVLSSFDLVKSGCNVRVDKATGRKIHVPVTCYSFEGPRVGNLEFADEYKRLKAQGLTAIRIVNEPDIVPDVPRAFYLQNVYYVLGALLNQEDAFSAAVNGVEWLSCKFRFPTCYRHVGAEILIDSRQVKWIRKMEGVNPLANAGLIGTYHNLEVVLHVLSGYNPRSADVEATPKAASRAGFGVRFTRDFALANKSGDNLNPRFGIAPNWHSTIVDKVATAKYPKPSPEHSPKPSPEPSPEPHAEPPASPPVGYLEKAAEAAKAGRYPDPRPAIIQPYDATQSPPNWGADEARVIGQGPQNPDPQDPGYGHNQWLEDIHFRDQAWFDKFYGLKTPVEEKGVLAY